MSLLSLSSSLLSSLLFVQSTKEKENEENREDSVSLLNRITILIKTLMRTETKMTDTDTKTNFSSIDVSLL